MYVKYKRGKTNDFNHRIEFKFHTKNAYKFSIDKHLKIFLEGKFYYVRSNLKNVLFDRNPKRQLGNLVGKYDNIEDFINSVEGEYCGIVIDQENKSLKLFGDKLKQLEVYYFCNEDFFIASEDPQEIINEIGRAECDQYNLINAILLCVPKGHTLFSTIKRLKFNEIITITQDEVFSRIFSDKDIEITRYSKEDLSQYNKILIDAILSRASDNLNLALSSGGWDSTLMLSILRKYFGRDKVKGITMKVVLSDGRCFNKFEVEKSQEIGRILDVKTEIVEIDYREKEVCQRFEEIAQELFYRNLFYFGAVNWTGVIKYIVANYGDSIIVFNGEGADSLHNYGFSQYISLAHDNDDFLEYADKMKNYLYSPTFFKKIKENRFLEDTVYKIFLHFNRGKEFLGVENLDPRKKLYYYLLSFVFSDIRVPFRKIGLEKYIKESAFQGFEAWLYKEYFERVTENINENNLYYYFSYLYLLFHLQSPQIRIFRHGLENVRFPYIDLNLFKFLYRMPQDFGRGLDFNRIKFPLKELAKKVLPGEVVKIVESGPHSYLSEVEKVNIYDEFLLKGLLSKYMKDKIDYEKIKNIFASDIFYLDNIGDFIKRFKQGKMRDISGIEARFLIILTLLSIHSNRQ